MVFKLLKDSLAVRRLGEEDKTVWLELVFSDTAQENP
jgi:hypothetical protein